VDKLDKVLWIEGYSRCLKLPKEVWQAFLDGKVELWNAPRPLYSTKGKEGLHKGEFSRGVFYAEIDLEEGDHVLDAEKCREFNRRQDAHQLEFVPESAIEAYRQEMAEKHGNFVLDAEYDEIVMSYVNHRKHNG